MHEPDNSVENPKLFTQRLTEPVDPKKVATQLGEAVAQGSVQLRNEGKQVVTMLDGYNQVLAQAARPERPGDNRQGNLRMNPDVRFFINAFPDALADLSDEIAASEEDDQARREGRKLDIDRRTDHAVINQRFAQALYCAARAPKGDVQRKNAIIFFQTMEQLKDTGLGAAALRELSNARAQTAIMIALENAGYKVLVPNHNDPDEVRDMDVLAMADLVAISPDGQVNFIDAKGLYYGKDGRPLDSVDSRPKTLIGNETYVEKRREASRALMRKIEDMGYNVQSTTEPNRVEITIPTDLSCISAIGEILKDEVGLDIIRSVRR